MARYDTTSRLFYALGASIRGEITRRGRDYGWNFHVRFGQTGHTLEGTNLRELYRQAKGYYTAHVKMTGSPP